MAFSNKNMFLGQVVFQKNTLKVANYLNNNSKICEVFHPALKSFYNHKIWKRDFTGSSGLFSFSLNKYYSNSKIEKFFNQLKIFKLGYSWGGFESLITFPPLSKRSFKNNNKKNIIRLYCGLEDSEDLIKDLDRAIKTL